MATRNKDGVIVERGRELIHSQAIRSRMTRDMLKIIKAMQADVYKEINALFKSHATALDSASVDTLHERQAVELGLRRVPAMDASFADMAASLMGKLLDKWQPLFDVAAMRISDVMVGAQLKHSDKVLGASLKDLSEHLTMTPTKQLTDMMDASTQESAALIKRVPAQYIPNVQQDVMRSITTGNGLQDLIPALKKRNVQVKNWAENTARDQTRKAYATINRERMEGAGIKKFEWIHSGGANQPRPHHINNFPAGLNHGIFSFDDPPVIDERTGETGFPGQAINCGCTMRPVIEFDEKE